MKYPDIKDIDFYDKVNKIYDDFKIPKKKKTLEQYCYPKKYELQQSQKFVPQYINPKTNYKSILVYHRIGSGKTCTAIRVGEVWKKSRKIVVVVPASLKGNFRNELRSLCAGEEYLTNNERELLKKYHPTSEEYAKIIEKSDERIDKYYSIYSYNKFIELAQNKEIKLDNSVLIIDEIQNMVSEEGTYYTVLYKLLKKSPDDLRIVLLSATPMFDKPNELGLTLNLLKLPKPIPFGRDFDKKFIKVTQNRKGDFKFGVKNMDEFKKMMKGYVSYFRGAPPHVFPEMTIKYVKCEMSDFQYDAYKAILRNEERIANNLSLKKKAAKSVSVGYLPNNFFIGTRYVSNVVFPNRKIGEEGLKSFRGKKLLDNLEKYSGKFYKIMGKIRGKGKMFVYSSFKENAGIKSFVKVLEEYGYKNYETNGEGRKRFAIWSGDEDMTYREEVKQVFNQKDNLDGSKLKLLLLTSAAKEGLSLYGIRQAHILEPYWNFSRLAQIIGRGSRFCSHKDLPEEERNIKVYIYMSTREDSEEDTIDEYIKKLSEEKNHLINEFEKAVKEVAIDCRLFKNANVYEGEDGIMCV